MQHAATTTKQLPAWRSRRCANAARWKARRQKWLFDNPLGSISTSHA
jgi:ABC-type transport system involved in cytochrome c biogenesis ATPase subunit